MSYQIRPYNTSDHDTVYEICLKTGNSGKGAEHLHDDPMILGHIYAGPYITLEPESAFVLEDEMGVCGYIIGALNTNSFYNKVKSDWLPKLQKNKQTPLKVQNHGIKMKNASTYFFILKSLWIYLIIHPTYILIF